jgi:hypothetical protein
MLDGILALVYGTPAGQELRQSPMLWPVKWRDLRDPRPEWSREDHHGRVRGRPPFLDSGTIRLMGIDPKADKDGPPRSPECYCSRAPSRPGGLGGAHPAATLATRDH